MQEAVENISWAVHLATTQSQYLYDPKTGSFVSISVDAPSQQTSQQALGGSDYIDRWQNFPDVVKLVDKDYFDAVVSSACPEQTGPAVVSEIRSRKAGTGMFQGGFFYDIELRFNEGSSKKLLFKYTDKPNITTGAYISSILRDAGHDFVPKAYIPNPERTRLGNVGYFNRGQFYEYIEGESLEDKLRLGEHPRVQYSTELQRYLAETLRQMLRIYSARDLPVDPSRVLQISPNLGDRVLKILGAIDFTTEAYAEVINLAVYGNTITNYRKAIIRQKEDEFSDFIDTTNNTHRLHLLESFSDVFSTPKMPLIHGDLHQGNILIGNDGKIHIIDWDNATLGVPYQDLLHLGILTDFDRYGTYGQMQEFWYSEKSYKGIPSEILAFHYRHIEFQTYLSLLARYYDDVAQYKVPTEFHENILRSCRYLLQRTMHSFLKYSEMYPSEHQEQINVTVGLGLMKRFPLLADISLDPEASVAYAHRVHHMYRQAPNDAADKNFLQRLKKVESMVIRAEEKRHMQKEANPIITDSASASLIANNYYEGSNEQPGHMYQFPNGLRTYVSSRPN